MIKTKAVKNERVTGKTESRTVKSSAVSVRDIFVPGRASKGGQRPVRAPKTPWCARPTDEQCELARRTVAEIADYRMHLSEMAIGGCKPTTKTALGWRLVVFTLGIAQEQAVKLAMARETRDQRISRIFGTKIRKG